MYHGRSVVGTYIKDMYAKCVEIALDPEYIGEWDDEVVVVPRSWLILLSRKRKERDFDENGTIKWVC